MTCFFQDVMSRCAAHKTGRNFLAEARRGVRVAEFPTPAAVILKADVDGLCHLSFLMTTSNYRSLLVRIICERK